jgi:hypothetical protein
LVYSGSTLFAGDRKRYYERYDLIHYALFPFAAYGILVFGGVRLLYDTQRGLTFVAAGMLWLLAIAIRNAWAIVIDVVSLPSDRH